MFRTLSSAFLSLVLVFALHTAAFGDAPSRIIFLHTNDLHGHLSEDSQGRGGLDRIATVVRSLRLVYPGEVLLIDAGDICQGTLLSNSFEGRPMIEAMNALPYDLGIPGNHEFDWGPEGLQKIFSWVEFPVVCANLQRTGHPDPFPSYKIIEVQGVKVGFLGLVTPDTPQLTKVGQTDGYVFLDPISQTNAQLSKMKDEGAEILVAVTHLGVEEDRKLAQAVPELDMIIGGHSHTPLDHGIVENGVLIVQAGCYARNLGVVEMEVSASPPRIVSRKARLVPITSKSVPADPQLSSIYEKYSEQLKPILAEVVGQVVSEIPKVPTESVDSPLGNLISDAIREMTDSDIAIYNYDGIRSDFLPAGPLTGETIFSLLPFDDPIVTLELTGQQLLDILTFGSFKARNQVQVSGLTAEIYPETATVRNVVIGGEPLELDRRYKAAVTEFLSGGGDGYSDFQQAPVLTRFDFARDVFRDWVKRNPTLEPPATGRLRKPNLESRLENIWLTKSQVARLAVSYTSVR